MIKQKLQQTKKNAFLLGVFALTLLSSCGYNNVPVSVVTLDGKVHMEIAVKRSKAESYHIHDLLVIETTEKGDWKVSKHKLDNLNSETVFNYNHTSGWHMSHKYRVVMIESIDPLGKGVSH